MYLNNESIYTYSLSIIISNGLGVTLELKIVRIVFLSEVSVMGVGDIVAPAHGLSEGYSVGELAELHVHVVSLVGVAEESVGIVLSAPSHEGRFEASRVREVQGPVFADLFVSWVAVQVLLLGHVNSADLVSVYLAVPGVSPDFFARRAHGVLLCSFVRAKALLVLRNITELIASSRNTCALDSTINELVSIGVESGNLSMGVHGQFISDNSSSIG